MPRFMSYGAVAAVLLGTLPIAAQEETTEWQIGCEGSICTISRDLAESGAQRRIATFLVLVAHGEEAPQIGLALPLGTAIAPGARLVVGERVIDIPFEVCFPDGCRALRAASKEDVAILSDAETIDIRFFAYEGGRQLSVPMQAVGLGAALEVARARVSE